MTQPASPLEMGEVLHTTNEIVFKGGSFEQLIDTAGRIAPEIETRRYELSEAARQLIASYAPNDNFFAADDNAIGLLLASALYSEAARTDGKSDSKIIQEGLVANSFARTLFGRYSEPYPLEGVRQSSQLPQEERLALHLAYTDPVLSDRLHEWFRSGDVIEQVRQDLGITSDTLPFNILVLKMGQPLHMKGIGATGTGPNDLRKYMSGLLKAGEEFMQQQLADPEDTLPFAYATTLLGQRYMCIMEPTARILLEPELLGYKDKKNLEFIHALFRHEFVHTQGSAELKDSSQDEESSYIGDVLEEYRAEVFSGYVFSGFYPDIYSAITIIEHYSQANISDIMTQLPYGGGIDKLTLYATLASRLGLNTTAKLAGLLPEDSINFQSPKSSRELYEALNRGDLSEDIIADMTDEQIDSYINRDGGPAEEHKADVIEWMKEVKSRARSS